MISVVSVLIKPKILGAVGVNAAPGVIGSSPSQIVIGIGLSVASVTFATPANANSFVATITVTVSSGTYSGTLTLGGPDAALFALSNGGVYPCNLMVGASNIPAGTYNITLTA